MESTTYSSARAFAPTLLGATGRGVTFWRRLGVLAAAMVIVAALGPAERAEAFSSSKPPTSLPSVSAGGYMTCAVRADNRAACWGANEGQNTSATEGPDQALAPANMFFSEVNAGYSHACGVRQDAVTPANDKTAVCWGSASGGASTPPASTKFSHVAPGFVFTCGLRNDTVTPANHETAVCWGTDDALQVTNVASGKFTEVTTGIRHACGLRKDTADPANDKKAVCWGSNAYNQITNAPTFKLKHLNSGNFDICGIKDSDDTVVCWGRNAFGQQTVPAGTFKQVSAGFGHVCGIKSDDTLACWGRNNEAQATPPAGTFREVSAGTFHSCAVSTTNAVTCWGNNAGGRVQPTMTSLTPAPVATPAGYNHQFNTTFMSTSTAASAVTWTVTGNPAWLTLTPTGAAQVTPTGSTTPKWAQTAQLAGTPPALSAGTTYTITVTATNGLVTASETFTVAVVA